MSNVGLNGSVNIVESPTGMTRFNLVNGLIYDRGLITEAFATEFKVEQRYAAFLNYLDVRWSFHWFLLSLTRLRM